MNKDTLAKALAIAWKKYVERFGESPHGTVIQLRAMLEFCPNIGFIEDADVIQEKNLVADAYPKPRSE